MRRCEVVYVKDNCEIDVKDEVEEIMWSRKKESNKERKIKVLK